MSAEQHNDVKGWLARVRKSRAYHNILSYLVFVVIAAIFWFILAMNDSIMDSFDVKVHVYNVPDTVTFINDPPKELHVVVRAKGTSLLRHGVINTPSVNFNFRDFSHDGVFRVSNSDILTALKSTFGAQTQVLSLSTDSMRVAYTTLRGRRIPVQVAADFTAEPGHYIQKKLTVAPSSVVVYSASQELLDTITRVFTKRVVRRNLSEDVTLKASVVGIPGARIVPESVKVTVHVEPLVSKEVMVPVDVMNVPEGESVVLFPSKVAVLYYVPMSIFNEVQSGLAVSVDYADIARIQSTKLPIRLRHIPDGISNVRIYTDSVEYTLVR